MAIIRKDILIILILYITAGVGIITLSCEMIVHNEYNCTISNITWSQCYKAYNSELFIYRMKVHVTINGKNRTEEVVANVRCISQNYCFNCEDMYTLDSNQTCYRNGFRVVLENDKNCGTINDPYVVVGLSLILSTFLAPFIYILLQRYCDNTIVKVIKIEKNSIDHFRRFGDDM